MVDRKWDIQAATNWWVSLGFHIDHTDPSLTLHLPGAIICLGRCKQPGFAWSLRRWLWNREVNRTLKEWQPVIEASHADLLMECKLYGHNPKDNVPGIDGIICIRCGVELTAVEAGLKQEGDDNQ